MRKSITNNTYKQPETPTRQKKRLQRSTSLRNHNQNALSNFWELPKAIIANTPSRVQPIISLNSPTTLTPTGQSLFIKYPKSLSERHGRVRASQMTGTSDSQPQCHVAAVSSDGSQEIECLTDSDKGQTPCSPTSNNDIGGATHSKLQIAVSEPPRPSKIGRCQRPPNVLESIVLDSSEDDFVEVVPKRQTISAAAKTTFHPVNSNGDAIKSVDLGRRLGKEPQALPVRRDRMGSLPEKASKSSARPCPPTEQQHLPSSPPMLRASSPTIRRFNSGGSELVVLADESQDTEYDEMTVGLLEAVAEEPFSGTALVGSCTNATHLLTSARAHSASTLVHTFSAGNNQANSSSGSFGPVTSRSNHVAKVLCKGTQEEDAELSSDPISEFHTQALTPKNTISTPVVAEPSKISGPIKDMSIFDNSQLGHGESPAMDNDDRSITQWYKENISAQKPHYDEHGDNDDSQEHLNSVLSNNIFDADPSDGLEQDRELHQSDDNSRSIDASTSTSTSNRKHSMSESKGFDDDDGYSSPLEGFWDLRQPTQGSTLDRDMYMNQFESSQHQTPARKRNRSQREASESDLYDRPSLSKERTSSAASREQQSSISNVKRRVAPADTRQMGGINPRTGIRPLLPATTRPAANRQASAKPAPNFPGYNHYADDPYLDMAGSMGWEGGGASSFG